MTLFSIIMIKLNGSQGHLKQQLLLCSRRVRRFQKAKGFTFGAVLLESQKKSWLRQELVEHGDVPGTLRPALWPEGQKLFYTALKEGPLLITPLSWSDI